MICQRREASRGETLDVSRSGLSMALLRVVGAEREVVVWNATGTPQLPTKKGLCFVRLKGSRGQALRTADTATDGVGAAVELSRLDLQRFGNHVTDD
ncbi:hypothetical protein BJF93_07200 [Xaviernesmea oryzae]|uniref:Uncharacterized protein n=1 Tax=Xaviernesmea oryzae TaxID=464029 RepID=A0A1Q9B3N9_9HYPH|nr:hypothetical protein BJF93_07200 [Xaviernesmea oryzae]SEM27240.1 hypothetical protein SAMN04487976_12615 [Xaviernesmea oryzae]